MANNLACASVSNANAIAEQQQQYRYIYVASWLAFYVVQVHSGLPHVPNINRSRVARTQCYANMAERERQTDR